MSVLKSCSYLLRKLALACLGVGLLCSGSAWASWARVQALQSNHLKDTELTYLFPTKLLEVPNYVMIQSGSALGATTEARPYLAAKKAINDQVSDYYALGVNLGRPSDIVDGPRDYINKATASAFKLSSNPININYAARSLGYSYAFDFFYGAENDKVNKVGNHSGHFNFGFRFNDLSFAAGFGLMNEVDDLATLSRLQIDQSFKTAVLFEFDDIYLMFDLNSNHIRKTTSGLDANNLETLDYKMSFVKNSFAGKETIFYRFNLETLQTKDKMTDDTVRVVQFPMIVGFESPVTENITLRSSIKQIIGVYHTDDVGPGPNTTTAAVGVGVAFNNLTLDGVLEGLIGPTANQRIDGNNLLTGTSLTYWF